MKRLLIALLLAFPAVAGPRDWTFYPPHIPVIDPPQVNTFCAANATCSITGAWTLTNVTSLTTASLTDSGLTAGNCVQATTGGLLTTVGSSCGTSSGTVTTTGSPASGNLAKFSGALSVTNADLTGDVTTSGGVATTLAASLVTCAANQFATQSGRTPGCTQPSFSNLSGTIASAQFGSQTANTFLAAPNGSSGNPTFRAIVAADLPTLPSFQINGGTSSGIFAVSGGSPSTFGNAVNYTTAGTSGGIPYFSSSTTVSSTGTLSTNGVLIGGGLGGAVTNIAADTTTTHALFATAGAPAFRAPAAGDFGSQTANTFLAAPNGSSGSPTFRTIATGDLPTGIPVVNLANGTSGQCINTSGTTVVWGSCAGTAGVQTVATNTTSVTVNAAVTTLQGMMTFSFGSAALNSSNKSFRVWAFGNINAVNTTETVSMELLINGSGGLVGSFVPAVSGVGLTWSLSATCTVTATGATGTVFCSSDWDSTVGGSGPGGGAALLVTPISTSYGSINLTGAVSVQPAVSFTTASASNSGTQTHMVIEQLN